VRTGTGRSREYFDEDQLSCLPAELRADRRTLRAVKEQRRKLFHAQIFDNELAMKRLYVQTCKRLPAYGCKLFVVREIMRRNRFWTVCDGACSNCALVSNLSVGV
jgi:hypothetical protein